MTLCLFSMWSPNIYISIVEEPNIMILSDEKGKKNECTDVQTSFKDYEKEKHNLPHPVECCRSLLN